MTYQSKMMLSMLASSVAVASFDNLDKNQSYAKSSAWKR